MHRRNTTSTLATAALAACIAALTALPLSGCYRRVVDARGLGSDRHDISRPYQEDTRIDRWLYGERETRSSRRLDRDRR